MRRSVAIILTIIMLVAFCGCQKSYDGPPRPDTPEPAPLEGTFSGEYGTLKFSGDGKTVNVAFSEALSKDMGISAKALECEYTFTWYNFGECRWDAATEFNLYCEEKDELLTLRIPMPGDVTTKRIVLTYYGEKDFEGMVFERQSK